MARPKLDQNLPPYVKARKSGDNTLYYYQRYGRQIPLGDDYSNAEERAAAILAAPPPDALGMPDAATIISKAVPIRAMSGIYFLVLNGAIAYVGQSADVWSRISQHAKKRRFDSFAWMACAIGDLDRLEAHFIEKFKPPQNYGIKPNFRTRPENVAASS